MTTEAGTIPKQATQQPRKWT